MKPTGAGDSFMAGVSATRTLGRPRPARGGAARLGLRLDRRLHAPDARRPCPISRRTRRRSSPRIRGRPRRRQTPKRKGSDPVHIAPYDNREQADRRCRRSRPCAAELLQHRQAERRVTTFEYSRRRATRPASCRQPARSMSMMEGKLLQRHIGGRGRGRLGRRAGGRLCTSAAHRRRMVLRLRRPRRFSSPVPKYDEVLEPFAVRAATTSIWSNTAPTTPRRTARSSTSWRAKTTWTRSAGFWSPSFSPSAPAGGRAFQATSTTPTALPDRDPPRRDLQLPLSSQITARVCRCCSARTGKAGDAYHIVDGSTILPRQGLPPLRGAAGL